MPVVRNAARHLRVFARAIAGLSALVALAVPTAPVFATSVEVPTTYVRVTSGQMGISQRVSLGINKSFIVDLPVDAAEVIVSQPLVATAIMRSKTRAVIQGTGAGDTNIFFLDGAGRTIYIADIQVFQPRSDVGSALEAALRRVIPGSNIKVDSVVLNDSENRVVLSGTVLSQDDSERALAVAIQFAGKEENVASIIDVAGSQQVMLKVTVAEVNRGAAKQFGINLSGSLGDTGLSTSLLDNRGNDITNPIGSGGTGNLGVSFDAGPLSIDATLRALEGRNAARLLAEPTLTALSGERAEFLVGGEFPVRTIDSDGNAAVEFKPFGVELYFTPTVRSDGVIGLVVETSVSEVTSADGALTKRRASTTVELPAGMTLAIGGLIEERVRRQLNAMPGIGDLPIIGALFRSNDFVKSQTELVILVTPYLARPVTEPGTLPTDEFHFAGDAEAIFLGHMEKTYGVGDEPEGSMRGTYDGTIGFVLD